MGEEEGKGTAAGGGGQFEPLAWGGIAGGGGSQQDDPTGDGSSAVASAGLRTKGGGEEKEVEKGSMGGHHPERGLLHLGASGRAVGRLPNGDGAGRRNDERHLGCAAGLLDALSWNIVRTGTGWARLPTW